ncbi:hypothetical protein GGTG_13218 [Gaeumannomyces tritici R3-111a-1]|uniref:Cytochrome P450 n=1 Tax=Gaeumannomyces tritici (strain R3-111a-1) TaxID=644352 RepID=J3PI90_GAET3|nr:hypothetical protein GGTG_13218 [Gaeumannomyces tritici R3-111a-1]EJT69602.1 hypothetical protein GGTG_13218 [Gaeumannomyces tritici R3-111a-1]
MDGLRNVVLGERASPAHRLSVLAPGLYSSDSWAKQNSAAPRPGREWTSACGRRYRAPFSTALATTPGGVHQEVPTQARARNWGRIPVEAIAAINTAHLIGEGRKPDSDIPISTREIVGQMVEIFLGGSETTSTSIARLFLKFTRNPDVWVKLLLSLELQAIRRDNPECRHSASYAPGLQPAALHPKARLVPQPAPHWDLLGRPLRF